MQLRFCSLGNAVVGTRDRVQSGTVTASTELNTLKADNVQHPFLSPTIWRSSASPSWLHCDFGAAYEIGVVAALNTNLIGTSTFRLQISNNADMSTPEYDTGETLIDAGVDPSYGHLVHIIPSSVTGRYLQIDFDDENLDYQEVGRLVAMSKFQPSHNMEFGYPQNFIDPTTLNIAEGGQIWTSPGVVNREIRLRFQAANPTEALNTWQTIGRLGKSEQILVVLNPDSDNLGRDTYFGYISQNLGIIHAGVDRYSVDLAVLEQK